MKEFFTSFTGISALIMAAVFGLAGFKLWQQSRENQQKKEGRS